MAVTLVKLSGYLSNKGIPHKVHTDRSFISVEYKTDHYQDENSKKILYMEIILEEEGRFLSLVVPRCYNYLQAQHKDMLLKTLLLVSLITKLIQFEYDRMSGYIRSVIEIPVEDGEVTEKQLMRCFHSLVDQIDEYHHLIVTATEKGILPLPGEQYEDMKPVFKEMFSDFLDFVKQEKNG
ncbi:MAG: hypothetical protein AB1798_04345 [Spirochaetota bacterium]